MSSHLVSAKPDLKERARRNRIPRAVCVNLLCLFYLISNTGIVPLLDQGKQCRCAVQVKTDSGCCCINSTLKKKSTASKSCCKTKTQTARDCCSHKQKTAPQSKSDKSESNSCQISSHCGCGNSSSQGLHTIAPRDLNSRPVLSSADHLELPLTIGDDLPVTLAFSPETPPPQQ
ncbi:hypothetical protein Pan241w_28800 [Gimesia alba]|uniref:Uncharacterized protein n=1 Tax=Gimesia alba TaxID=2527973 RepID=A0A517RFY2_9PLAN|nr:hypothetical protein [Gimesia alba]QDT42791.1 hypothetical protein Pan241w_28800 [Gimesia alba]